MLNSLFGQKIKLLSGLIQIIFWLLQFDYRSFRTPPVQSIHF